MSLTRWWLRGLRHYWLGYIRGLVGLYGGYMGNNGKEHRNYYDGLYRVKGLGVYKCS